MTEQIIFGLLVVLVFWLAAAKTVYSQLGRSRRQSSSLNYLAQHKDFSIRLINLKIALVLSLAFWLAFKMAGLWGIPASLVLIAGVFFWLPKVDPPKPVKASVLVWAGLISAVYGRLGRLEQALENLAEKTTGARYDSGIYTLDDLKYFLSRQPKSKNNRIDKADLNKLTARLDFDGKKVQDIMVDLKHTRVVGASETIGPILIDELHGKNQLFFPVQEEFNKEIIGILDLHDLTSLKKTGSAKDAMNPKPEFISRDEAAGQVLDRFFNTGAAVYVVTDEHKKPVGIVSVNQTVKSLMEEV